MDTRTIPEIAPENTGRPRYHGGDIDAAKCLFPSAPAPWIDLSTGINPLPYPIGTIPDSAWTRLPGRSELAMLEAAARIAYGAPAQAEIVAAPGTQALIQWLPRLSRARTVGILGLTYSEHERCWTAAGAEVTRVQTVSELEGFDIGIVVNPNNPDGRLISPGILARTAEAIAGNGGLLIVDEAFMDCNDPGDSLIPLAPYGGALVLRSFGKMYGLAGIRLGFAVASREFGARLREALGPWAVSGPAIDIASRALRDEPWLAATVAALRDRAKRLDGLLVQGGFAVIGGTPLFRLASHRDAARWFDRLGDAGILTRPFHERPDWLRFGIPGASREWERLAAALGLVLP